MKSNTANAQTLAKRELQLIVALRNATRKAETTGQAAERAKASLKAAKKVFKQAKKAARRAAKKVHKRERELQAFLTTKPKPTRKKAATRSAKPATR